MSNDTMVTVQGWLAAEPVTREVNGNTVTNFRMGCTPRRFHRGRQEWVDGETQWYSVTAWRQLGANCAHSLKKGDPVVVHGRLQHRTYVNASNVEVVSLEIDAITVGHDLSRGVDMFMKSPPRQQPSGDTGEPMTSTEQDFVVPGRQEDAPALEAVNAA